MNKDAKRTPMTKLKDVRKSKKISQRELGERIGVDKQTIYRYEVGAREPSIAHIRQLANALDVSVQDII